MAQHVSVIYRWAHDQADRLPALMAELLAHKPQVIATNGGGVSGIYMQTGELNGKRLQLLREMVPRVSRLAALVNPNKLGAPGIESELRTAASRAGVSLTLLRASTEREIDAAFALIAKEGIGSLVVSNDPFLNSRREQLVALATRQAAPAIFDWREFAVRGGLMSYGSQLGVALREQGAYVARVQNGAKPADLPVLQPRRFELVINRKTAKSLGLVIPQAMLLRADALIE